MLFFRLSFNAIQSTCYFVTTYVLAPFDVVGHKTLRRNRMFYRLEEAILAARTGDAIFLDGILPSHSLLIKRVSIKYLSCVDSCRIVRKNAKL